MEFYFVYHLFSVELTSFNFFIVVVAPRSCFKPGTKRLAKGKKKDAVFIASLFDPWVQKLDPQNSCVDCVFFYGASNVQLAGQLLSAKSSCIHVQTCAAHLVSLFFSDVCKKLWQFHLMLVNYCQLFHLFKSGSMHSPYALFCSQSKNFKVGLLFEPQKRGWLVTCMPRLGCSNYNNRLLQLFLLLLTLI
jgi:hypothetical protein